MTLSTDSTGALPEDCTLAHSAAEAWRCFTAPTIAPYIKSPLFVLQSQFDHFQLSAMARIPCAIAQTYFPPWANNSAAICSEADLAKISSYGAGWFEDFTGMLALPNLGVFVTACVAHEERGTAGWTGLQAAGVTLRDAFYRWHHVVMQVATVDGGAVGANSTRHWIDSCEVPCNGDTTVCAPIR